MTAGTRNDVFITRIPPGFERADLELAREIYINAVGNGSRKPDHRTVYWAIESAFTWATEVDNAKASWARQRVFEDFLDGPCSSGLSSAQRNAVYRISYSWRCNGPWGLVTKRWQDVRWLQEEAISELEINEPLIGKTSALKITEACRAWCCEADNIKKVPEKIRGRFSDASIGRKNHE